MAHSSEMLLTTTIPTDVQVPYTAPSIPSLLSLFAYLVLLAAPTLLSNAYPPSESPVSTSPIGPSNNDEKTSDSTPDSTTKCPSQSYNMNAGLTLIIPLFLGALFGPSISSNSILSTSTQRTLMDIGYIGVLLLIFEAGVSLDAASLKLMRNNAGLSTLAALTGVLVPIALSMGLGMGAYGYTGLQSFASGASLSSTSVGTTLVLLSSSSLMTMGKDGPQRVELRRTRVGCVLVCAALLDDIIGLVIAGIIPGLAQSESGGDAQIRWPVIVRPILVSAAFGVGTPVAAMGLRWLLRWPWKDTWDKICVIVCCRRGVRPRRTTRPRRLSRANPRPQVLFIIIILCLMAFVAGSAYAGTSELFGAYLAGAFIGYVFEAEAPPTLPSDLRVNSLSTSSVSDIPEQKALDEQDLDGRRRNPAHVAFSAYLQPILTHLLAPLFFASIGAALPIKAMFATHPDAVQISFTGSDNVTVVEIINGRASHQVIWRGSVYAILMVLGKMVVGLWMLVWPDPNARSSRSRQSPFRLRQLLPTSWFFALKSRLSPSSQKREDASLPRTAPSEHEEDEDDIITRKTASTEPSRLRSALLLGLAMVARGEIALIVAQLARPLLVGPTPSSSTTSTTTPTVEGVLPSTSSITPVPDEEPFAVVIWAILLSTVGGALGVGALIAAWERRDREEAMMGRGESKRGDEGGRGCRLSPGVNVDTGMGDKVVVVGKLDAVELAVV